MSAVKPCECGIGGACHGNNLMKGYVCRFRVYDDLVAALTKAAHELNAIRARDGVPYNHAGYKSDVCEDYFSSVVDECHAALSKAGAK